MAQKRVYHLISTKAKGLKFRVMHVDTSTMKATLQGDTGVPFVHSIDQKVLDDLGYTIETTTIEVPDEAVHSESETT